MRNEERLRGPVATGLLSSPRRPGSKAVTEYGYGDEDVMPAQAGIQEKEMMSNE